MEILFLVVPFFTIAAIVGVSYLFYTKSKKVVSAADTNFDNLTQAVLLSELDQSNLKDYLFKRAVETLRTDEISVINTECYGNQVSLDAFINAFKKETGAELTVLQTNYAYGELRVMSFLGKIGTESFVMFTDVSRHTMDEKTVNEIVNLVKIKPFFRKVKRFDNVDDKVIETEIDNLLIMTRIYIYTVATSAAIKNERVQKAITSSEVIYKKKERKSPPARIYTFEQNAMSKQLTLRPINTNKFNYNFDNIDGNYENITMSILKHKAEIDVKTAIDYAVAAALNNQNTMLVGEPGVGKTAFSSAVITRLSHEMFPSGKPKARVILLDAMNLEKLQSNEFSSALNQLAEDEDDVEQTINFIYMEDAEAVLRKSFDDKGQKTAFGSFFLSMLDGTSQKLYNLVWLITSNEEIHTLNEIVERRFNVIMPFKKLSLEKAKAKAVSVAAGLDPEKQYFDEAIWADVVEQKKATNQFSLADIYGCVQPVTKNNIFQKIQQKILESAIKAEVVEQKAHEKASVNDQPIVIDLEVKKTTPVVPVASTPLIDKSKIVGNKHRNNKKK